MRCGSRASSEYATAPSNPTNPRTLAEYRGGYAECHLGHVLAGPTVAGPLPEFDPDTAPADPDPLFERWLAEAIDAGVVEPHAMTLSTVDPLGRPTPQVLILKYLRDGCWAFVSGSGSRKGKELADTPWAALTFY